MSAGNLVLPHKFLMLHQDFQFANQWIFYMPLNKLLQFQDAVHQIPFEQ